MKLLALWIIVFTSVIVYSQDESEEYEDFIYEEECLEYSEPLDWCHSETLPYWKGCDTESIGDLEKCTNAKIIDFIQKNLRFPSGLGCFEGVVFVEFIINREGNVEETRVLKGVHKSVDAAAIDVINKLPKFYPATQRNRPVDVKYVVPVRFKSH